LGVKGRRDFNTEVTEITVTRRRARKTGMSGGTFRAGRNLLDMVGADPGKTEKG